MSSEPPPRSNQVQIIIVLIGGMFLLIAIIVGAVHALGRSAIWISLVIMLVGCFGIMWVARWVSIPVRTVVVKKADGTTETVTGKYVTKSYLVCPECGKDFFASGVGTSYGRMYYRDPERWATKNLRWHLIQVHHYGRLEAQKAARTAPFRHEERPA